MSAVEDFRKVLQDFLAPELATIREKIDGIEKVADARFQAAQTQYAAIMTNLELIKQQATGRHDILQQQIKNNHDAVMNKLDALAIAERKKEGAAA